MMKLAFVGKDFENVTHTCSNYEYLAIKSKVLQDAENKFKTFQFIGESNQLPQVPVLL